LLAGKYERAVLGAIGVGRLVASNPFGNTKFSNRNWRVLDKVLQIRRVIASNEWGIGGKLPSYLH